MSNWYCSTDQLLQKFTHQNQNKRFFHQDQDNDTLKEALKANVEKPVKLKVYSSKTRCVRGENIWKKLNFHRTYRKINQILGTKNKRISPKCDCESSYPKISEWRQSWKFILAKVKFGSKAITKFILRK